MAKPKAPAALRGYGPAHQRERKKWKALVEAGGQNCSRCGLPISPGELWDLDHTDDRTGYLGPSHRHCNRSEGARKRHAASGSSTEHLRWEWQDCADCGRRCYGTRCIDCHRADKRRVLRWADEAPMFSICLGCGEACSPRAQWCGSRCYMRVRYRRAVGIPDHAPLYARAT